MIYISRWRWGVIRRHIIYARITCHLRRRFKRRWAPTSLVVISISACHSKSHSYHDNATLIHAAKFPLMKILILRWDRGFRVFLAYMARMPDNEYAEEKRQMDVHALHKRSDKAKEGTTTWVPHLQIPFHFTQLSPPGPRHAVTASLQRPYRPRVKNGSSCYPVTAEGHITKCTLLHRVTRHFKKR